MISLVFQWYGRQNHHTVWDLNFLHVFSLELTMLFSKASFMLLNQVRSSDTSTAESGSEVEEMASPKSSRTYLQSRLTPVCEEVRICN